MLRSLDAAFRQRSFIAWVFIQRETRRLERRTATGHPLQLTATANAFPTTLIRPPLPSVAARPSQIVVPVGETHESFMGS